MVSGRKPGFKHSAETIEKIRQSRIGRHHSPETREKISSSVRESVIAIPKSRQHRLNLSLSLSPSTEELCEYRYSELLRSYPQCRSFFEERRDEVLVALRDVKSEKELNFISQYVESEDIGRAANLHFAYSSSSFHAHEDVIIDFIDSANYLKKFH